MKNDKEARKMECMKLLNEVQRLMTYRGYEFTGLSHFSPEAARIRFQRLVERDPFFVDTKDANFIHVLHSCAKLYDLEKEKQEVKEVKTLREKEMPTDVMVALGLNGYDLPAKTKREIKRKPHTPPQTYPAYSLRKEDAGRLMVYFSEGQVPVGRYLFAFKDKEIVLLREQHIIDKIGALPRASEFTLINVIQHTVSKRSGSKKDHRGTRMTPAMRACKAYIDSDIGWEPGETLPAELVIIDGGYKILCPHLRKVSSS